MREGKGYLGTVLLVKTVHWDATADRKGFHRKSALTRWGLTNSVRNLTSKLRILIVLNHPVSLHEFRITFRVKPPTK